MTIRYAHFVVSTLHILSGCSATLAAAQDKLPAPEGSIYPIELKKLDKNDLAARLSSVGDQWVAKGIRELGCDKADIFEGVIHYGVSYRFFLDISAGGQPMGVNNVTMTTKERFDFNGSDQPFPRVVWVEDFKKKNAVVPERTTVRAAELEHPYAVSYHPTEPYYNDGHADLIIAFRLKWYEKFGEIWNGPYEKVSSCALYEVVSKDKK